MSLKIDLHVHSCYSPCSNLALRTIEKAAQRRGLDVVAITDHNTIAGALELAARRTQLRIIVAEEIKTQEGEIIGYFLTERIPPALSVRDTIGEIRRQGGLVSIPHPFDIFRRSRLGRAVIEDIISEVDMIEVFNARDIWQKADTASVEAWKNKGVVPVVGSDAHQRWEIGKACMMIEDFTNPREFLARVRVAQRVCKKSPLWVHLITKIVKQFK